MSFKLKEIANLINGEIVGDENIVIEGASSIEDAGANEITFLGNPRYESFLSTTGAACVIVSKNFTGTAKAALLKVENPSLGFSLVMERFAKAQFNHPVNGINKSAVISPGAKLGKSVSVGANSIIEDGAAVGDGSIIYPLVYIGKNTKIGANVLIYPNVTIRENVLIGNNCIIHSGTVVGSDGFGYAQIDGMHKKIPQIGTVIIEDDVEIGSNVSIDRARFDSTVIGRGTKIDNLVQIAHNVKIGKNCLVIGQAGIAGSAKILDNCIIAAQAGINGHITIGENVVVGSQAGVTKSLEPNQIVLWSPAKPAGEVRRTLAYISRLGDLNKEVKELRDRIKKIEEEKV